jgi:hypothetical protein
MARKPAKPTPNRIDVVFIRKSTQGQDEKPQIANVQNMLAAMKPKVSIPADRWFVGTVSRRKVKTNPEFNRLLDLIGEGRVGTVYIESQDRWGTADRVELFALLGLFRQHKTRLFDLTDKRDLTEPDFITELLNVFNSYKSEKELKDTARRSIRTRYNRFLATNSWPTGAHPFGYGKRCCSPDGTLLWEFQPISRSRGQVYYPDKSGEPMPSGPPNAPLPSKKKKKEGGNEGETVIDLTTLIPSKNKEYVKTVELIFNWYARVGLSRRQISTRLNKEGRKFYDKPFTHTAVTLILKNPAYVGDTVFGKTQTGELHTWNDEGVVVEVTPGHERKPVIKRGTHKGLIDRKLWNDTQKKLLDEESRTSFAPRNPAYYLKQIFVCGHCGKNLSGRTEIDPTTKARKVVYVCQSWMQAKANGQDGPCGHHRITHDDAEKLLMDKIKQENLKYDQTASELARSNTKSRLKQTTAEWEQANMQAEDYYTGAEALIEVLQSDYGVPKAQLKKLKLFVDVYYTEGGKIPRKPNGLSLSLEDFKKAVREVEAAAVQGAEKELKAFEARHKRLTLAWAEATDMSKQHLKAELDKVEQQVQECKPKTERLSDRVSRLFNTVRSTYTERMRLLDEWPAMENREKGEALRRVFKTVTLYWKGTFHSAEKQPGRPRKTKRPGRWSYKLLTDKIKWDFESTSLGSSW